MMKIKSKGQERGVMTGAATARAKKVSVDLPTALYEAAQEVMREQNINTSSFVRQAVERYLESIQESKLERELREGYLANAELDRQISDEFAFADAELA